MINTTTVTAFSQLTLPALGNRSSRPTTARWSDSSAGGRSAVCVLG
ncbi:MAG: hypothetical protein R3F11_14640 [Verrucomicrobiales bacterium]